MEYESYKRSKEYEGSFSGLDLSSTAQFVLYNFKTPSRGRPSPPLPPLHLVGGPGISSTGYAVESTTVMLHSELKGEVNVYTMDHRGSGRSTKFECVAAQVTTTGSPWRGDIDATKVPACAKDLHIKYGNLSAFSMTTAATDLATFVSKFTNEADTIVYGSLGQLGHDPNSTCAALITRVGSKGNTLPSHTLRSALGTVLMGMTTRTLIPHRLDRCGPEDINILAKKFPIIKADNKAADKRNPFDALSLYYLIVFSEMMESPCSR
ncbi:uncharacterized protein PITG_15716 [Phytophthora infestans T30-4]|uniref:Serine protease family S33 n=1 Tax=Phytophthora infestans (strain T30-4) TaxID=403677 RepID=D0NSE3_PHYIT|nr:uncharacterized protein PITG_15716 [Phytophthora infestans T30-4]EEY64488.1 conserved hypothetical protein [Phytophthora infestans T30-4]|eukprot:XP_002897991.1 conserved hypothetical protein [Phytophthora infestans T30-4]